MVSGMNRAVIPGVIVLLLALSGCVSVETTGERVEVTPGASGAYSDGDTTVEVEPLTAETPAAEEGGGEDAFLSEVRENLRPDNVIPNATDEQLLAAGADACKAIAADDDTTGVSVISGEQPTALGFYTDSGTIIQAARAKLCP